MLDLALSRLGWDDAWAAALAAHLDRPGGPTPDSSPRPARVCRADRDACDVLRATPDGVETITTAWSGPVQRSYRADPTTAPVTGDWVVITADAPGPSARPIVAAVLPRRSAVVRAQADGSSHGQVLAANADITAVVEAMAPDPDPARIERLLSLAWSSGGHPVVVLTKADLVSEPDAIARDVASLAPGAEVLPLSATAGSGLEPLRRWLAEGATIALLGASGVGKSTLLNALTGAGEVMRTQPLRSDGKGRHTTVTRELHLVPGGGAVLDTPGMRTVGLAGAGSLDEVFGEIEDLAVGCRFSDCAHRTEPGCAVLAAVAAGDLPERRLASYRKLLREAQHQAARTDARLRAEMVQVWKERTREHRRRPNRKL